MYNSFDMACHDYMDNNLEVNIKGNFKFIKSNFNKNHTSIIFYQNLFISFTVNSENLLPANHNGSLR